jgi:hypothetical protein
MRYSEKDRRGLIEKLKKVRDPRERDRIIWALAGQEDDLINIKQRFHNVRQTAVPGAAPVQTKQKKPASGKAPDLRNIPRINVNTQRILGFVLPVFFLIFGLVRIAQALLNYMASGQIEPEVSSLVTGGFFLIVGLAGMYKATRPGQIKQDDAS